MGSAIRASGTAYCPACGAAVPFLTHAREVSIEGSHLRVRIDNALAEHKCPR